MSNITKIIPTMQSISLLSDNISFAKKKKKDSFGYGKQAVKNIVGIELIDLTSSML